MKLSHNIFEKKICVPIYINRLVVIQLKSVAVFFKELFNKPSLKTTTPSKMKKPHLLLRQHNYIGSRFFDWLHTSQSAVFRMNGMWATDRRNASARKCHDFTQTSTDSSSWG